ncbi:MAG: flavodoxin family protein [Rickettsiales bacterium]|jgi:multimeric flavodoxin WrbA|nr:flavodoxin family protein [Rickettsiales bacterium]
MKVVAVNGSPRKDGNTSIMLRKILNIIEKNNIETKFLQVGGTNIHGCRACRKCGEIKNKKCIFDDDVFNELYKEIIDADAIILGTPSYFSDMTPEMKAFIDRTGFVSLQNGGLLKRKIGAGVVAQRRGGASHIQASLNHMFLMSEMFIVGSTYWNIGFGLNKGDVENDKEAMTNMENLGENITWLIKKIYEFA